MATNLVGRRLPLRALLLAGGLLAGTATLAQDASTARKPFYCFAYMNPMDGRGFESAYSSIMLGSPDDQEDLKRSFSQAAQAAGTLNSWPDSRFSGCYFFDDADKAATSRDASIEGFRSHSPHVQKYYAGELAWDGGGLASPLPAKRKNAAAAAAQPLTPAPKPPAAQSKYIEVPGPNGMIRLSPEVAARNRAAQEEYERKLQLHAEVIAQAERDAAKHAQSVAKAAAEKLEHERQLAANAARVAAHKAEMDNYNKNPALAGRSEGTFQATSAIRATKDEAMASLMGQSLPPITNVQCKEVTFYKPARWTCWGTYRQAVSQSSTSKQ